MGCLCAFREDGDKGREGGRDVSAQPMDSVPRADVLDPPLTLSGALFSRLYLITVNY